MPTAAALLRTARHDRGLSQRALADRARVRQPGIADIETGAHDTTVDRLEQLLAPLGYRVSALPTRGRPVWEAAAAIRESVQSEDAPRAWRELIQLADDLAREPDATRVALAVTPPLPTGSARHDAVLAAVTDYRLRGLPKPGWLDDPAYTLAEPWDVEPISALRRAARRNTPPEIRRHGVYLHRQELESL